MNIDFGRPFQFVFEDQEWLKKVLIGGLVFFIPLVGIFILMGYQKRVIQQVAEGSDTPLPEWEGLGEKLVDGLKMFVVAFGYILPGFVIYLGGGLVGALLIELVGDAGGFVALAGMCVGLPLLMIGALLSPVGILRFVDTDSIGAAFSFGEVISFVKENVVNILLALVIGMILQFVAQFGLILCFVGVFFTGFWAMVAQGQAWGQVLQHARSRAGGGSPSPSTSSAAASY